MRVRDWNVYPYQLKGLAGDLMYAHYEQEITAFRAQGVHAHQLSKTDGRNWSYQGGRIVSSQPTWPVYLLWSEAGAQTIDFSGVITGSLNCVAGRSGAETLQSAASLPVPEEPITCADSTATFWG